MHVISLIYFRFGFLLSHVFNDSCILIFCCSIFLHAFTDLGLSQPEHATLEGFENFDLSDLTMGVDWSFAEVRLQVNITIKRALHVHTAPRSLMQSRFLFLSVLLNCFFVSLLIRKWLTILKQVILVVRKFKFN